MGRDGTNPIRVNAPAKFLSAEWRYVAMLNYAVDPGLIAGFVPAGTQIDLWQGKVFISLVGFRFLQTKVMGVPLPFHRDFDEVNLRFYVCRQQGSEVRRGVVFVREIVPRWAVAQIARTAYNENYVALPMSHTIETQFAGHVRVEYACQTSRGWNRLSLRAQGEPQRPEEGSEEQFIAEHYWGYTKQRDGSAEYRVDHPSWRLWSGHDARFEGDAEELYGRDLAQVLATPPTSAFLAEGSAVTLYRRRKIASCGNAVS